MPYKPALSLYRDGDGRLVAGVGPGIGIEFIKAYFPGAKTIRIASAYFSLAGYKLGGQYTAPDVQYSILVGREEGPHVRKAVLEEILAELQKCDTDLWSAIDDLLRRIETGQFRIRDAREMQVPFHCKFYICDDDAFWHGSANYSKRGLESNAEQITLSVSQNEIALFTKWFDEVSSQAHDLLSQLVGILRQWLEVANPFDAFLKVLSVLNRGSATAPGLEAHAPTYYQEAIITRALTQLDKHGGALIVLATGLGKTVVGANIAYRTYSSGKADRLLLLAPRAVRDAWAAQLDRSLPHAFFSTDVLFRPDSPRHHHQISRILKRLSEVDQQTLIIVDEAHFYRNQLLSEKQKKRPSRVFQRLKPAIAAGAKIVLLTATAYGTDRQNLNSLLRLLPHNCKGYLDVLGPWEVQDLDEFRNLPVVNVLGLPDVLALARKRGDVDAKNQPFIPIAAKRHYLPNSIKLIPIFYELPLASEIARVFDDGYFNHKHKRPTVGFGDDAGEYSGAADAGFNAALSGWLSSPPALLRFIDHSLETVDEYVQLSLEAEKSSPDAHESAVDSQQMELLPDQREREAAARNWGHGGYAPFTIGREARASRLNPIRESLTAIPDQKLQELVRIVRECSIDTKGKVLIFVRLRRTALYLEKNLHSIFAGTKIGCTVELQRDGPALKPRVVRDEILRSFSPGSHRERPTDEYDVLICTDADGVGVNLQDADTVVNYDPPTAADVLFQRAGRVLRMTTRPERLVAIYTFIPSVAREPAEGGVHAHVRERFTRLSRRHDRSRAIIGSTVLTPKVSFDLMTQGQVDVEEWFRNGDLASTFEPVGEASLAEDHALLDLHRERIDALPLPVHSVLITSRFRQVRVAVLFEHEGAAHLILFNPGTGQIEPRRKEEVLAMIRCDPDARPGLVRLGQIEGVSNQAVRAWAAQHGVAEDAPNKVVAVYLQPSTDLPTPKQLLVEVPQGAGGAAASPGA
jgi:superfamily II DNA or RNA helicase